MNKIQQKKHLQLMKDTGRLTRHYKMFKTSKGWCFAAISLLTFSVGIALSQPGVQASDTTPISISESSQTSSNSSASSASSVASSSTTESSDAASSATTEANATASSVSKTNESSSATTKTNSSSSTSSVSSAATESNTSESSNSVASSKTSNSSSNTSVSESTTSKAVAQTSSSLTSSAAVSSVSTISNSTGLDTTSNSASSTTSASSSVTSSSTTFSSVASATSQYENGETLVDPTSDEIAAAQSAGSAVYAATGESQKISAVLADEDTTSDAASDATTTLNFWTVGSDVNASANTGTYGDTGLENYVYTSDPFADSATVATGDESSVETEVQAKGIYGTVKWYISEDGVLHLGAGTTKSYLSTSPLGKNSPWYQYQVKFTSISIDGDIVLPTGANYLFANLNAVTAITAISGAGKLDFTNTIDVTGMFLGDTLLESIEGSGSWNLSSVRATSSMFYNDSALQSVDASNWQMSSITSAASMFFGDAALTEITGITNWSMASTNNLISMFSGATKLTTLDLSGWDTSKVTNMGYMFNGDASLTNLNLTGWNTSNVFGMAYMFAGASSLTTIDVSTWNTAKLGTGIVNGVATQGNGMDYMFSGDSSISELNLGSWDTSNVTGMTNIFSGMTSLKKITFGDGFVTTNVTGQSVVLPNTTNSVKWVNVGTGSETEPEANIEISAYDGTNADTYVLRTIASATVTTDDDTITYGDTPTISISVGSNLTTDGMAALTSDDYTIEKAEYTNGGTVLAAGQYSVVLNANGIKKLQAVNPNYTISEDSVIAGTIIVNPKAITVTADGGTKVYGEADPALKATVGTGIVGNDTLNYTVSRVAGENVGSYDESVELGSNANYDVTTTGGQFTITAKTTDPSDTSTSFSISDATSYYGENSPTFVVTPGSNVKDPGNLTNDDFTFIDKATGQVVDGVPTDVGSYEVSLNDSGKAKVAAANPNYNFSDGSFVSGTYTIYDVITHSQVTVTRTVQYTGAGSRTPKDVVQTLIYDVATSKATGISTYTPQGSYAAVTTPKIAGFTDSGNVEALTPTTSITKPSDSTVTVTYTPVNEIEYSEITVTRTIHYTGAGSKTPHDVIETIVYKVATNKTTGEVSYTPQGIYEAVKTPNLTGYTDSGDVAELIPSATMARPENSMIVVTYKAISGGNGSGNGQNPTTPGNGNTGNNGGNSNGSNGTNGSNGNNTVSGTSGEKTDNGVTGSNVVSDNLVATKKPETSSQSNQQRLPQTDENNDQAEAVIGVSLLGMLLALFGIKRRKHDED
ncbi:BspA family leucine-rich repeat surface protein [Pediococcus ethanolidurans]|uniref:BspA family leucine-rich repeat surface protein n=1 Tax=Pediococcus ethanolidurans TaxID=319653 RepID=UPI0029542D23|nr:BspA family leucine-rich repeat surface protein [Pediococcus ethanolidurans]